MIELVNNASSILEKLLNQKENRAFYYSTRDSYFKEYQTVFSNNMQNLITKIGLMMSKISKTHKINAHTFLGSIKFLCDKVINEPTRKKFLDATSINDNGNKNKHSLDKNEEMNFEETVRQYNYILNKINRMYNLPCLMTYQLNRKKPNKNIFAEKRSVKYEDFSGNKLQFRLSPFFTLDKYAKQAVVSLAVDWKTPSDDDLKLIISSKKSQKELLTKRFSLKNSKYENFDIAFTSNDMFNNNQLELLIDVVVYRNKEVTKTEKAYYTTGILFWKERHSCNYEYKTIEKRYLSRKQVEISQTLREEKKQ